MSEEPKWFSGYVKTHDQDHQELEEKLDKLIEKRDKDHISELLAISERIGEWVDDYTEFKSIILNFWDNSASYHARQGNSKWALEIRKFIKRLKEIKKENKKEIKQKAYLGFLCPECGKEVNMTESYHHFLDRLENAINRDFLKELNALEKRDLMDWSSGDGIEVEAVGYSDIEKLINNLEKDLKPISEPKKPSKCHIMGIECLFPKITCSECIVYKEYQERFCPETKKLIEKYKKDREATVSRSNNNKDGGKPSCKK